VELNPAHLAQEIPFKERIFEFSHSVGRDHSFHLIYLSTKDINSIIKLINK